MILDKHGEYDIDDAEADAEADADADAFPPSPSFGRLLQCRHARTHGRIDTYSHLHHALSQLNALNAWPHLRDPGSHGQGRSPCAVRDATT